MSTYSEVLKLIEDAKAAAEKLEVELKKAQSQNHAPGQAHVVRKPTDKFDPVNLSNDLKDSFEHFNATMKSLDSIRNQGGGTGGGTNTNG